MKEYIKKFANASDGDNYLIENIPFMTSVEASGQNLVCNQSGKKLVNVSGILQIQSAGPEMVDLGLSVKWAANNVGANPGSTPESYYGDYYAWGETKTKYDKEYSWETYAFGSSSPFSKYDSDGKIVLESVDDVAAQVYGSDYRMPTATEIQELIDGTSKVWVTDYNGISGLNGCKFMKKSDHSVFIFIPAAGNYSSSVVDAGNYGYVWSSSLNSDDPNYSRILNFDSKGIFALYDDRYYGLPVRAVEV